jgi:serine/threonine protein kinase
MGSDLVGRRLAHYDVTAHLGSGGMGDVYKATDTRLGRSVALKFLQETSAQDTERAARFAREARMLAALNHPAIAAIYGVEAAEGHSFLVMEFVPGETLADRIGAGSLVWTDALGMARQIAEALEAAHERGIVHRDLKPANVKIAPDGRIKVLDFGLAKLSADAPAEDGPAHVSAMTVTMAVTRAGVVLGTPAYMAPEQAAGRAVDRRADLFAFGCVLYEMLAGERPFEGDSAAEILSRVLEREPDWSRLPPNVPPAMQRLVRLCLEKDPKRRRQSAGDVRIDLEQIAAAPHGNVGPLARGGSRLSRVAWLGAGVLAGALIAMAIAVQVREPPRPETRLEIVTPPTRHPLSFALSPDGRSTVFVASGSSDGVDRLYLRSFGDSDAEPIAGTEGASEPFWSPDSRSVGFFAAGKLWRIDIGGGSAQALAAAALPLGGAWSASGTILFAPNSVSGLFAVPASGGDVVPATRLDAPRQTNHRRPAFLPDGRQFLFYGAASDPNVAGLFLGSLDGRTPTRLTPADSSGAYLAPDRILFLQQGALVARRFEPTRRELVGDPVRLADSAAAFSVSATGVVAYRESRPERVETVWVDRRGTVLEQLMGPSVDRQDAVVEQWRPGPSVNGPELSPDERRLAGDRTVGGNRDIWLVDLARGGLTRFTTHPAIDGFPIWSPDGSRIAFHSNRKGTIDLWISRSSETGTEQLLFEAPDAEWPIDWSQDGRFLLYQRSDLRSGWDLWALPMTGSDRTPVAVATTSFVERLGEFSPDGDWVVYETDEPGRPEIMLQPFPNAGGRLTVSTAGGTAPRWRADGSEIYFVGLDGRMMAVGVTTKGSTLELGTPLALFSVNIFQQTFKYQYAVSRDRRFLINMVAADASAPPIRIILHSRP